MKIYKIAVIAMMAMICQIGVGQVTVDDNLPFTGRWVGFDVNSLIPLPIENRGFDEIDISSNLRTKIAITELPTWNGLNGLQRFNVQRTTMGLRGETNPAWSLLHLWSGLMNNGTQRDWMNVGTSYTANGDVMYTGLLERPFTGGDNEQTDAVIAWGCQPNPGFEDNFRFLFVEDNPDKTNQGLETMRITPWGNIGMGAEFSNALQPSRRLVVHEATDSAQFRIAHSVNTNPILGIHADFQVTDKGVLHIKNRDDDKRRPIALGFLENEDDNPTPFTYLDVGGITRIRDLREDTAKTCLILGAFADTIANGDSADHYLTRLDFTGDNSDFLAGDGTWQPGGGSDSDWETDGTDVWTGHGQNGFPDGKVFIGVTPSTPFSGFNSKLSSSSNGNLFAFYASNTSVGIPSRFGGRFEVNGSGSSNRGASAIIFSETEYTNQNTGFAAEIRHGARVNIGVSGVAAGAFSQGDEISENIGVQGVAIGSNPAPSYNYGVSGFAVNGLKGSYGVYGETFTNGPPTNFAGYFLGNVFVMNGSYLGSDENIKTNISEVVDANSVLNQLNPVSYQFRTDIGLPYSEGEFYGLISQEVEGVIPAIVRDVNVPERRDSLGEIIREEMVVKSIRYNDLISILIKGHQEQNTLLTDQAAMLAMQEEENEELLSKLNALKSEMAEMKTHMTLVMASIQSTESKMNNCCGTTPSEKSRSETGAIELEQNFPNPFDEATTIKFSINAPAQIRLEISDSQGRVLEVLVNQSMDKGEYTERWDASAFAPGTYYYSLYADTELLTKKMIKR